MESNYTYIMDSTNKKGEEILKRITKIKPFIQGSFTITHKKCGNPNCKCAKQGPIHETALLTWKENNKTRTIYIPINLRKKVKKWVEEGKRLKKLIRKMSKAQREFLQEIKKKD